MDYDDLILWGLLTDLFDDEIPEEDEDDTD